MHPQGPPWFFGDPEPELPPMWVQGPPSGTRPPEVEGEMDFHPTPPTNVNLLTQLVSESPALSRKRRHPHGGEEGEDEGGVGGGEVTVVSGGLDNSPCLVAVYGETSGHCEEDTDEKSSEERKEDGDGEGKVEVEREESGDSDVEDILATFCSSPSSSDCD